MDPMSVSCVAGATVQFVDFSQRLFSETWQIYRSASGQPLELQNLSTMSEDISRLSDSVKEAFEVQNQDASALNGPDKELFRLCQECDDIAATVLKVMPKVGKQCSMKTLAAISSGYCDELISRTADVMLKERRKLVLVARETPLSDIHLRNMLSVTKSGGIIFPPVPAYYIKASSIEGLIDQTVGSVLDLFDLDTSDFERWEGWKKTT